MQVGDNVRKMLGAVCEITDAGNPVVFQPSPYPNYIYNWSTGKSTQMYRENGQYKVQLWMKNDPSEEEAGHESGKGDSQAVLEANAVEEDTMKKDQGAVAVADSGGTREPEAEEDQEYDQMPEIVDSSDDENKPVEAEKWVDGVDEEESSGDESESEFELLANEEDKKGKKGFRRPEP